MIRDAILEICGVKEVFELPQVLLTKLLSSEQPDLLERIGAIYGDRQLDQFRDFFQEEGADRKKLKQDYTPDGVAELLARVSRSGKSLADICAGTGSLTIQYLNYHPDVEFVRCEEFSARVIPFLLINLAIRKIDAEVIHGDSLTREHFNIYAIRDGVISQIDSPTDRKVDVVISNPPYSIKFKDLPEEDRQAIQAQFPWKKSGVVDDIFLLKSLKYTKRYGFYIMFPGIAYRGTEKIMRQTIGNQLAELNAVRNGFEDTGIEVLFLVIDKEKTSSDVYREIYDAKLKKVVYTDGCQLTDDYHWETPREPRVKEEIDIDAVNKELDDLAVNHLEKHLMTNLLIIQQFHADIDYLAFIRRCRDLLDQCETYYRFGAPV
ncbi:N-6 DNA methylase [Streptococcus suis]